MGGIWKVFGVNSWELLRNFSGHILGKSYEIPKDSYEHPKENPTDPRQTDPRETDSRQTDRPLDFPRMFPRFLIGFLCPRLFIGFS